MSIISNALRKAQDNRGNPNDGNSDLEKEFQKFETKHTSGNDQFDPSIVTIPGEKDLKSSASRPKSRKLLLIIAAVVGSFSSILATLFFFNFSQTLNTSSRPTSTPQKKVSQTKQVQSISTKPSPRILRTKSTIAPKPETQVAEEKTPVISPTPTVPKQKAPVNTGTEPILSGIMYSPTAPKAIINGAMTSEGETVDGFKIIKILPEKVRLSQNGKETDLILR